MNERYSGRAERLGSTLLARVYRRLYVHPSRFYGDMQREGIVNWHRRVDEFAREHGAMLLDLGSGKRRLPVEAIACDLNESYLPNVVGDVHALPFKDGTWNGVVIQHVLEHVMDPELAMKEIGRVLADGAQVFCEVPFLFPVHDRQDLRRWTISGLEDLCGDLEILETGVTMGPFSALSALLRRTLTLPTRSAAGEAILDLLLGWLLWPLKHLDRFFKPRDVRFVAGAVYLVARKRPAVER